VIVCKPHAAFGMVAVIVVGDPVNIDKLDPSALPGPRRSPARPNSRACLSRSSGADRTLV